jgi:signal transduction histidine kinase
VRVGPWYDDNRGLGSYRQSMELGHLPRRVAGHWVGIDCASAALIALAYIGTLKSHAYLHGIPHWAGSAVSVIAVLPVAFRRIWPRTSLALVLAGGCWAMAISIGSGPLPPPIATAAALCIYVIPLRFARREALWIFAVAMAVIAAVLSVFASAPLGVIGLLTESELLVVAAWTIGYTVLQQRSYAAGLQERAARRADEQLDAARRTSTEERLQIARELHDVVAHSMSLIAVQAGIANYVVSARPDEAIRALSSIEDISRGALSEMRTLRCVANGRIRSGADSAGCWVANRAGTG